MAKTKNKSHSELENVRGYIREMEKEIRSLRQQLRQFEKYSQTSQDEEYDKNDEDTHVELKFKILCTHCEKNYMVETLDLGHRGIFGQCICGHKGRMK